MRINTVFNGALGIYRFSYFSTGFLQNWQTSDPDKKWYLHIVWKLLSTSDLMVKVNVIYSQRAIEIYWCTRAWKKKKNTHTQTHPNMKGVFFCSTLHNAHVAIWGLKMLIFNKFKDDFLLLLKSVKFRGANLMWISAKSLFRGDFKKAVLV